MRFAPFASAFALAAVLGITAAGCGKNTATADAGHAHAHKHEHKAPHGGTAVALGQEAFHLELVRDPAAGKLTAYVLDGHMETFIRLKATTFGIVATVGGEKRPLLFRAVANPTTGETVGDSAQFEALADWLKTTASFDAVLTTLEIRGTKFDQVAFNFPKGNDPH